MVFLKEFIEKVNFEKNQQTTKNEKLPRKQRVNQARGSSINYSFMSTSMPNGPETANKRGLSPLPARDVFCRLMIAFANSLNPDHARQIVGHDLGPSCSAF